MNAQIEFAKKNQPHPSQALWSREAIEQLFSLPFLELVYRAASVHREHFDPQKIQLSTLVSIKTGGCPENCGYCPQSAHHEGSVQKETMMSLEDVIDAAKIAKANGASRFCMGAAWRSPNARDLPKVEEMIKEIKALGMETCATLGMLRDGQAEQLKAAGLDYYNHNLDTAPEKYADIIQTREYEARLDTLGKVRKAGLNICCGGIIGMNETRQDRAALIESLANLTPQPESVPVNQLVKVSGTPLANAEDLDWTEFVRTIAVARITLPKSYVRLSAGRTDMPEAMQALCFMAGANSIFYGEKLLTTANPEQNRDRELMNKLNLEPLQ